MAKWQKDGLKERLSTPLIGKVSEADPHKICNMCGNSYQYLHDSTHKYTILCFEILIRSPKRQTITCHLCNDCIGNMHSTVLAIKRRNHTTNRMNMSIIERDQREADWLWRNRIGLQQKEDGGTFSYHRLPLTDNMQVHLEDE